MRRTHFLYGSETQDSFPLLYDIDEEATDLTDS
jgi:hypothetical protein